jgi:flagellar hook assembly protein FlgD
MDMVSSVSVPGGNEPPAMARWGLSLAGGAVTQNGTARFLVSAPSGAEVTVQVFDVAGRRVRTVFAGRLPALDHELAWDLRDDAGRRVPGGLYFARLAGADHAFTRRLVVLP